jgi:heme oxygenase
VGYCHAPIFKTKPHKVASRGNQLKSSLAVSAMASLREATWPCHQRLERRLDVKARFSDLAAYRAHLEKMWGFCAALEQRLGPDSFGGLLTDYLDRRKLPLLRDDLVTLGAAPAAIELLTRCDGLPICTESSAAFGCAYVLEGATLGGRTLLPLVHSRLGLSAQRGASFLASYGEQTSAKWRSFGTALEGWCRTTARTAAAAAAAVATFESLEHWLCGQPT